MNGTYEIYKRNASGIRETLIQRYTGFSLTLNWGELSSFSISGATTGAVELTEGDGIVFYRNGSYLFGGIVEEVKVTCKDVGSGLKEWVADGYEDSVMFERWLAFADPAEITFNDDIRDVTSGYAWNRIIYYVRRNMGADAMAERQIAGLTMPASRNIGQSMTSSARFETVAKIIYDIGDEADSDGVSNGLNPRFYWDPVTGAKSLVIEEQRDKTDILIAPEYCNLTQWEKVRTAPTCNVVWACSDTFDDNGTEKRIYVYKEDAASIAKYGRYEKLITATGCTPGEDLTQSQAYALLGLQCQNALRNGAAAEKFSGTMIETPQLRFMEDWQCGDLVTCIIDGESFTTTIKTVEVDFTDGIEAVKPTLGECEHGEFSAIFKTLRGLDDRVTKEEIN